MDIEKLWEKAKERTEVIRGRVRPLSTFRNTRVPYLFLAESVVNEGCTVVRKGRVTVEQPMILLPEDMPQFEGFDFDEDLDASSDSVETFFLMRGIRFPSLKYHNTIDELDLENRSLSKSVKDHKNRLERVENVSTALLIGAEDCWQFSILLYMAGLVARCARRDIVNILNRYREDGR